MIVLLASVGKLYTTNKNHCSCAQGLRYLPRSVELQRTQLCSDRTLLLASLGLHKCRSYSEGPVLTYRTKIFAVIIFPIRYKDAVLPVYESPMWR